MGADCAEFSKFAFVLGERGDHQHAWSYYWRKRKKSDLYLILFSPASTSTLCRRYTWEKGQLGEFKC
jgi:hypothetical protein